ncbi:MAG: hypothetical protein HC802_08855 [Caldilineaceae bacterium]|nr:hypothetical protein [Caldilineaceae bacterium]
MTVTEVVSTIMTDQQVFERFERDPLDALADMDIDPTPGLLRAFEGIDADSSAVLIERVNYVC